MNTTALKSLLMEYDKKRRHAQEVAEKEKEKLYQEFPQLANIDKKINTLALSSLKEITLNNDQELLAKFQDQMLLLKKEKENILASIGVKASSLLPHYECTHCQDTGYVSQGTKTQICNCLKQKIYDIEYNKSNMNSLEKQNFENFNIQLYSTDINPEKYQSDISPRENIELILKICQNFVKNFDKIEEKNLLFTGKTGLGKTFLSSCIAKELLKQGKTVLYQTASVMLDTIIDYRFGKATSSKDIYEHLLNVDLLVIDDLGTEGTNQMKLVELFNILNSRLLNSKKVTKTMISTNLSLQALFETYDERIVSRLVGNYDICYFFGEDIRFMNS
ncbi:MAG: ATP-binding protein [Clostridia bacterium]|nr:ATP-binding protein [Clostridia bacterium]